ncbi:TetR/AcrR family transcriptional regulator [Brevundimonas sp. 3P9-tot-E]|uniref:TetR/AcrR family transcriptional regulator n=1 Tax=Brevundimonas TaxID=41275 RepID=UPI000F76C6C8|nr:MULTISPECIES: TetR/AcrR family transcriptional regulator [Brevundimonas]MDA0742424.1 TetR/AcrR family transcriptional regulator [Pseudomonadota bacterium]MBK1969521.1 TetR/AcrR family transcriptional regulator [Brevundimonas diminuta]MBK1975302.1 TetR/AcrR family transcriptional regulator [Brevundimonas diminuta]MDA1322380.1 TetR/AcrR family transcriptional regulator [Pseudomonadota bacterium]MDM8352087.1 TetR/AcrR family transcriptional regulator [Brevundimonas diminuta]
MSVVPSAPAPRSSRKPKGEGHERRAEILAAAERIFVESGYDGATIRKIADKVGLSSTALYMHFADKGEILNEICRNTFEGLAGRNRAILADPAPPLARLRRIAEGYVAFGFENPNAYRLAYLTPAVETRHGAETIAQRAGAELFAAVVAVVEDAVAEGVLRGDARVLAQVIWASVHGLVSIMITKPYFDWADRDVLIRTQLDVLFKGLTAQ